jgi:hypothetical protein
MKQRIELGIAAFDDNGVPYTGGQCTAGVKLYISEKMAR